MKPYYDHGGITIYHGDCREIIQMLDLSKTICAVDPPYGINHSSSHGASWDDSKIQGDHNTELRDWIVAAAVGRPMFCFGSNRAPRPTGLRSVLIWDKGPASGMGDLAFPWKQSFEEIYIFGDGWFGKRDEGILRGHTVLTWESAGRKHPHEKPKSIYKYFLSKNTASLVVDPTCGGGNSLLAAKECGLCAVGIEIEEKYCEIAARRLSQEVFNFEAAQ